MTQTLLILAEAVEDIAEARRWYDEASTGLGERFLSQVDDCIRRILRIPTSMSGCTSSIAERWCVASHLSFSTKSAPTVWLSTPSFIPPGTPTSGGNDFPEFDRRQGATHGDEGPSICCLTDRVLV